MLYFCSPFLFSLPYWINPPQSVKLNIQHKSLAYLLLYNVQCTMVYVKCTRYKNKIKLQFHAAFSLHYCEAYKTKCSSIYYICGSDNRREKIAHETVFYAYHKNTFYMFQYPWHWMIIDFGASHYVLTVYGIVDYCRFISIPDFIQTI